MNRIKIISKVQNQMYPMPEIWPINGKCQKYEYKLVNSKVQIPNTCNAKK